METLDVLVVDDEAGMRMGVARALRDFTVRLPDVEDEVGFAVRQAASGEQALDLIAESAPDVCLLDYKLPGISGLNVLGQLPAGGETLTIMITAYASLETAVSATKRGAYDFLAKPFTPEELRGAIRKAARHVLLQRQARRLAEEKRRVRFEFISVLAHELKAPLAAIEGYLHLMDDHQVGEELGAYDQMIDRSLIRLDGMRKLIFDLLDLTRIESGQKTRTFETVDVVHVARMSLETVEPDAEGRGITLTLHADDELAMQGDRGEIEIILNNLVTNAVKYNRDGGRVDVTLTGDDETVTLAVADTGIGMSAEECGKLFREFVRIKNDKTRNILGSGLGLSTVKKLAGLYHGEARVQSTPDVGTTFTVVLGRHTQPDVAES